MVTSPSVIVVGAGFGGLAAAVELRRHGITDTAILEAAPSLGGTWHHNTYPGAACDVPSHLYSYSWAQRRGWSRLCSPQTEILDYLRGVARDHDVESLIETSTSVDAVTWDEQRQHWTVETRTADGATARRTADAVVLATGQLNQPAYPSIPGLDQFTGHTFHSARWDHAHDLRGRRVAVVGTGASAVQFVPAIAPDVERLAVFQRSGNWILPRKNKPIDGVLATVLRRVPGAARLWRLFWFEYTEALTLMIRHPRTLGRVGWLWSTLFMRMQLRDPDVRRRFWPRYRFGCKRVLFSSAWLPALQRPNVDLVTDAITRIVPEGLETADGTVHEVDTIVWGTGFRTLDFMLPMRVTGVGGVTIEKAWATGPHAHLGVSVPGFPNLFVMYGPNTNTSGGSIIHFLEAQAQYVRRVLQLGRGRAADIRAQVEAASDEEVQARFAGTAWTACDSWYRDEGGRIVTNWPGYMREYARRCNDVRAEDYDLV